MACTPQNFSYNSSSKILSWDSCPDTYEYQIAYAPSGTTNWSVIYTGPNTSCSFSVPPGDYIVYGRKKTGGAGEPWGVWGTPEPITVP